MGKKNLTKERLASGVAIKTGLTVKESKAAVGAVFEILAVALGVHEPVEIRGFGAFRYASRPGRMSRNPRTGEAITVGPKIAVKFRVSKDVGL